LLVSKWSKWTMEHFSIRQNTTRNFLRSLKWKKSKEFVTLMATNCYLGADEKGNSIDQTKYRGIIGSQLYLTASRPNIIFSVYMCARYQSSPKESHFSIIKRIMKYLKGNLDVGWWYPKGVEIFLLEYSDSNFSRFTLDRKNTSSICHLLSNGLVSWNSKNQACVALFTDEAEYIVVWSCCAQILCLNQ